MPIDKLMRWSGLAAEDSPAAFISPLFQFFLVLYQLGWILLGIALMLGQGGESWVFALISPPFRGRG